ncbi:metal-dependent hydrolase [Halobacteriales archaeon Cl-PHB]
MMLPTHALVGMLLALPVAAVAPEFASVALLGGLLGGGFPDLDMYVGHRKTLHFPVYYSVAAATVAPLALLAPTVWTVGLGTVLVGAAVHCVTDVFGGGLELRPWEGTSDRAVYDHHRERWIAPRRWVDYDGSPQDLLLSVSVGLPLFLVVDGPFQWLVAVLLGVAAAYTTLRRRLADLAPTVAGMVPDPMRSYVPARYR